MNLGCGEHVVVVHLRDDLTRPLFVVPWTSLEYGRVLDDTSDAAIGVLDSCCHLIQRHDVRPWVHQVAVYRSDTTGGRPLRAWSGPIQRIRDVSGEPLTFEARDLSAWHDRRLIHDDHDHIAEDLSDIYQAYWEDSMAPDPVPDYTLQITASGVTGDRSALAEQHLVAGDELREIGRTALDWTVIDRIHRVGPQEIDTPPVGLLMDKHFTRQPDIEDDGTTQANRWVISGSGGGAEGDDVYGEATATPGPEGLLEQVASEPAIQDAGSAIIAADTRLARSRSAQRFIREAVLAPSAPVSMDLLVPGARVRIQLQERCLPVMATQRLTSMRVTCGAGDEGQSETVAVTFEPLGTVEAG